jgi:pSer/pThr/pTyr-binding forkhead associated (FHA) protein
MKCPSCNSDNLPNYNFCLTCGYDLKAYREAFPNGVPAAGPPPEPARTSVQAQAPLAPTQAGDSGVWADLSSPAASVAGRTFPPPPRMAGATDSTVVGPGTLPPVSMPPPPAPPQRLGTPSQMYALDAPRGQLPPLAPLQGTPVGGALLGGPQAPPRIGTQGGSFAPAVLAPTAAPPAPPSIPPATSAGTPCSQCGAMNAAGMRFCGSCGTKLGADNETQVPYAAGAAAPPRTMFMHASDVVAKVAQPMCKLVTIDQAGREGMTFTIQSGETVCGRVNGVVLLFDDAYVSPTHCRFAFYGNQLKVTDQNSLNGVYVRLRNELELTGGEYIRLGRQLFRYETLDSVAIDVPTVPGDDSRFWGSPTTQAFGRLVQILDDGRVGEVRLLTGERAQVGREQGELLLPTDGFVSGRHCAFASHGGRVTLADLGSSNGTYVRIRGERDVGHGDFLLVGNQMLRVEIL